MPKAWAVVASGQVCSLLTALTGACATAMATRGCKAPTAQNAPTYVLLTSLWWWAPPPLAKRTRLREAGTWLLLGLVDVQANTLVVWAYEYTSLTSVMLLDCFTIPCVMLLSRLVLSAKYSPRHALGALVCGMGVGLTVASDLLPRRYGGRGHTDRKGHQPLLGDLLCLGSAFLYAVSNVAQEAMVKTAHPTTWLSRLGLAGAVVSSAQAALLGEIASLRRVIARSSIAALAFAGYVLTLFLFYLGGSHFLAVADAAALNLSLLTADVWAVLYAALVAQAAPPPLYYLAFACTATGVVLYHTRPPPTDAPPPRPRSLSFGSSCSSVAADDALVAPSSPLLINPSFSRTLTDRLLPTATSQDATPR